MSTQQHEGRPYGTADATGKPTIRNQSIATTDNPENRCLDCDTELLARGYHRCRNCLIALRDGLHRRHGADLRLSRRHG
jgi:hypothetical protein